MKRLLLLLLTPFAASGMETRLAVMAPSTLGKLECVRDKQGFHIVKGNERTLVKSQFVDKELHSMDSKALSLLRKNGYIKANLTQDGSYSLEHRLKLRGGGISGAGAGFWIGKWTTYFVAHSAIGIASAGVTLVAGPGAGWAFFVATEKTLAIPIEAMSNKIALGCSIAGAAATGPV